MTQLIGFRIPKPDTDYDWMHPSWRDLVIEHLQASKIDRDRFLSRCGPQGVLLALSTAGGGKGTRETPLLVDAEDWTRLQVTVLTLLKSAKNSNEVRMVLRAIHDAMFRKCGTKQPRLVSVSDSLYGLAMNSLGTLRTKWDTGNHVISAASLSEYYRVSVLLSPLPPLPDMRPTWEDRWASVEEESGKENVLLDEWTQAISEWLDLAEIVASSEPRLLQQMAFPGSYCLVLSIDDTVCLEE